MDTKEYTVTEHAGPKVAGQSVKAGEVLRLTEMQARHELLTGAIVEKGKEAKPEPPATPAAEKRLADTRARARGAESARDEQDAAPSGEPAAPPAQA